MVKLKISIGNSQEYCLENAHILRLERIKICQNYTVNADYSYVARYHKQCLESPLSDVKVDACLKDFGSYGCLSILEDSPNENSITVEHIKACGTMFDGHNFLCK